MRYFEVVTSAVRLDDPSADVQWPAKAANLAALARAGLPVPPGVVVPLGTPTQPACDAAIAALLGRGPVIVRGCLAGEDEAEHSAAGLGLSVGGLEDLDAVRSALADVDAHRHQPWLRAYRDRFEPRTQTADVAIVQHHVRARWSIVAAALPDGFDYVEVHPGGSDALAAGTTPAWAGSLARWDDAARPKVQATLARARQVAAAAPHGLDAELVIDEEGEVWIVQVRPIVVDLTEHWDAFLAEVERQGQRDLLHGGVLVLDAEHNPAPLSFAHAWVMQALAARRPRAGRPTVLAGWLYVRTLVRDLGTDEPGTKRPAADDADVASVLTELVDVLVPQARARLSELQRALEHADPPTTAALLDDAFEAFVWMIDRYLERLVPARARGPRPTAIDRDDPLSVRSREAFADVLPTAWDIAAPTLSEVAGPSRMPPVVAPALPDDPIARATLLTEWDDHLFALGLAPLRRVYLRAGALLGVGDDVFALTGDELRAALRGQPVDPRFVAQRHAALHRFEALRPPLRIEDGHPVWTPPAARARGLPIGPSFEGRIAQRRDLAALLRDPPPADAIVVMPALAAQAAVALEQLGVRAVCCAFGGALSHAALMARELGLSALIGCRACLDAPEGAWARLDTRTGRLLIPRGPA